MTTTKVHTDDPHAHRYVRGDAVRSGHAAATPRSIRMSRGRLRWLQLEYRDVHDVTVVIKRVEFSLDGRPITDADGRALHGVQPPKRGGRGSM
jgi:hypothetical protein